MKRRKSRKSRKSRKRKMVLPLHLLLLQWRRKNHFNPCDEQTKFGNFTTKIRKFFRFHCVRAASNPFRLVLDTVTPCTTVHGSPRPLYPSSFKCAPAFTTVRSRYLPGGPGCAHDSSCGLLLYKVIFCVSSLDVNHSFEPSRVSFVFQK